jgi:SAM-dependent methyltransferase
VLGPWRILDAGSGTGHHLARIAATLARPVIGLDLDISKETARELTRDGGRGFASPFLHRRKADPTARPYPLPGTLTFFGTVFMAL